MEATLIFPHQLFEHHPALKKGRTVFLYEDPLFFNQYNFHLQKLILHRASMQSYAHMLRKDGYQVVYLENKPVPDLKSVFTTLSGHGVKELHYASTSDYLLERRLKRHSEQHAITLRSVKSPDFLLTKHDFETAIGPKKNYFMASFYIQQRRKFQILVENGKDPVGGKWSFDPENRKRLPAGVKVPVLKSCAPDNFVKEAQAYAQRHYKDNYGSPESFRYPVNHHQARQWLDDFLEHRLALFGDYEDAITAREPFLFHSVLTPALNIGLLTPEQILTRTLELHRVRNFPLNSLEGFIRQIIGWREFMRGMYMTEGVYMRTRNFLNYSRSIPKSFWTGQTGIPPVDDVIRKVLRNGYAHHIERLMVLGNFMHLCGFHPDEVYRWFMELFIDAYDWVMVPNVYGMSQYAAGDLMTTKPYISGSNYILKMSDYRKGEWCRIWDALYWRYLIVNQDVYNSNIRMKMVYSLLGRMDSARRREHLDIAEHFMASL